MGAITTSDHPALIGREREQAELERVLADARGGRGGLLLLAGEAGIGKTRLARETLQGSGLLVLVGEADEHAQVPYAPLTVALRAGLRAVPEAFGDCAPLSAYLGLLLPELGSPPDGGDWPTLVEAVRCVLQAIGHRQPAVIFLDDLQWADSATLEVLPAIAGPLEQEAVLIVGAYRNDEIPRGHSLRRMRTVLRRAGRLREIMLEPLDAPATAMLAARILAASPGPRLARALYDRTQGVPFFIEELAGALLMGHRLQASPAGLGLAEGADLPVPETIRDAVLLRAGTLSAEARRGLEVAAAVGMTLDLDLLEAITEKPEGVEEALERGFLVETGPGRVGFRHALVREALYSNIPWGRRRLLHRRVAEYLEAQGMPHLLVAEHWLAGREHARARGALVAAADAFCRVHAYRDAAAVARRALELWPEGEDEADRLDVLDQLARCAELSGDLIEAIRVWQEVEDGQRRTGDPVRAGEVQRRLAAAYELQGAWERALAMREAAAESFTLGGSAGDAAGERLTAAAHLQSAGRYTAALDLIARARADLERADRVDLRVRAAALEGHVRAKLGEIPVALELARSALSLALAENLPAAAADAHYRLAAVLEQASDYLGARGAYQAGVDFCQSHGLSAWAQICVSCLALILRSTGEWDRAMALCRNTLDTPQAGATARAVAAATLGSLHAYRGATARARPLLAEALTTARRLEIAALELDVLASLAVLEHLEQHGDAAEERCRIFLTRWGETEDRHFAVPGLRWAATFFASHGSDRETRACAGALAHMAARTGNPEAVAALAHALGEIALLEGDAAVAAEHLTQALGHLRSLQVPHERAQTEVRAGFALARAGHREAAIEKLVDAYRTARKLGARPLALGAAHELAALGERVDRRLGRRAAGQLQRGGLSVREVEVLRLVAVGRTSREIARELFLSPRTVDMHIGNILAKLEVRSRAEATAKAAELGLLDPGGQ